MADKKRLSMALPALLLGHGGGGDPSEEDGGADGHQGHEESGLHTACEEAMKAIRKEDVEGFCEAMREIFKTLDSEEDDSEQEPEEEPEEER